MNKTPARVASKSKDEPAASDASRTAGNPPSADATPPQHDAEREPAQGHDTDLPDDRPATDEELIDEAVDETFPASDPISPSAAQRAERDAERRRQGGKA